MAYKSIIKNIRYIFILQIYFIPLLYLNANNNFQSSYKVDSLLKLNNQREILLKNKNLDEAFHKTKQILNFYIQQNLFTNEFIEETKLGENIAIKQGNYKNVVGMLVYRANATLELGDNNEAINILNNALKQSEKINDINDIRLVKSSIHGIISNVYQRNNNEKEFLKHIEQTIKYINMFVPENELQRQNKVHNQASIYSNIAVYYYKKRNDLDIAKVNYLKALKYIDNEKTILFTTLKSEILIGLSKIEFEKKEYLKAINYSHNSLTINKRIESNLISENYKILSNSYLELNNIDSSKYYFNLKNLNEDSKNKIINKINYESYKKIDLENKNSHQNKNKYFIIGGMIILITLLIYIIFIKKKNEKRFKSLIDKLNQDNNQKSSIILPTADVNQFINKDTYESLILKLDKFEKSDKFLNKNMNISVLSNSFKTNTKYLSYVINNEKQMNFNTYINSLRINYIINKLYNDSNYRNYKIAYLAEEAGFSSRVIFNSVFKKHTGISPSFFIKKLK